ncbi:MAG: hypothetical protein WCY15_04430 [Phenylobacterium sp.]|jgi:hypothetical protein|uniref:hypothetical protein n=1 Tax=Phenylobacterium sp. TaxID=1871053 RepID=UPI002A36E59A|nr:hypothetical protein [Phenylobacterium sp.]MDX9997901.1 hypothetical protein [Phenylobacterium sp.]
MANSGTGAARPAWRLAAIEALNVIVALQFIPLLAALAGLCAFTWRRTGSHAPGALLSGLFVTWYVVAGTATHVG